MYLGSVGTNTGVCLKLERHGSTVDGLILFLDRDRVRVEFTGKITASGITGRFTGFDKDEHGTINLTGTLGMQMLTGSWQEWPESKPESLTFQRVGQLARRAWRSGFRIRDRGQRLNAEMTYPVLPGTNVFAQLAETVETLRRTPPMVEENVTWDMIRFGLRYGGIGDWESKTAIDIVHLTDTCMSLRVFGWADTGGAHGNWVVYGINLVKEGDQVKQLTLEDCFTEGSAWFPTVSRLIIEGLREQEASDAMGEDYTLNRVDLTFTVSEDGLVFMFSPYAVGSYAQGAFFVTVPWESLRPVLRSDIGPELLPHEQPLK